jgi:hypothetical protein
VALPCQGDSGQATRLGVVPGVVPWRAGCDQPVFADCAAGEELSEDCWLSVGRVQELRPSRNPLWYTINNDSRLYYGAIMMI